MGLREALSSSSNSAPGVCTAVAVNSVINYLLVMDSSQYVTLLVICEGSLGFIKH